MALLNKQQTELLRSYVERIRHLEWERKKVAEDIKAEWNALKTSGFPPKLVKEALRRIKLKDHDDTIDAYQLALDLEPVEVTIAALDRMAGEDGGAELLDQDGKTLARFGKGARKARGRAAEAVN
jgi:uncharacterized protein (UPF0335 family)